MTEVTDNTGFPEVLQKCPTGIRGLDDITDGGLPGGRPTLIAGGPGSGKTLIAMEFLVRGATQYDEPGVFIAFEEREEDLVKNFASLGFDLKELEAQKKLLVDYIHIERSEIEETGEYDLEGLFIRLNYAIDSIGAKRVVLDTIESLFSALTNEGILRAELRRLFHWLKTKGVTAIITGERGGGDTLTRRGLEEYVSDCVITLDHRVEGQIATRRLRVVKYRGSKHGTNEYPFLIDEHGISVLPITSLELDHDVSTERIPTGVLRLDTMLGGGFYRGSSILISGTAGTGKTTLAASFARATCERGERCLYLAFEEAPRQIIRNMRTIGIDLEPYVRQGLLKIHAARPTIFGLELHLVTMYKMINEFKPSVAVVDPITNLITVGSETEVKSMLTRLIDMLKASQITALFTHLTHGGAPLELTEMGVSSLIDTWALLRDIEIGGERNRGLYILKSRGMEHSNQIREFLMTGQGIDIIDAYTGPAGVLTGTARVVQEAKDRVLEVERKEEIERKKRDLERQRKAVEAQIAALRAEYEAGEEKFRKFTQEEERRKEIQEEVRKEIARIRKADVP
ncbi:RecA-superfamily ATPase possibly involved in signal transduction [Candidatus Methanoperedens nitroreducens]|uniref:non-specific serine/threonine protein kinase n=1 Tax=Candidatus Methanoperedens nitratireducens TaxID=1392998 RepID=A0A062V7X4_9EURY|nr:circadian clock protein KaiC [Candidatus Methanoperedens nitroreducens]KCZ71450.1 RecA-superfamily ATPase possibly involved in signal transduction [Candidatus Methanoperedens nitroreducens]MDJ1421078.1 circadian clock protein KaiC [Candidatus Methanoperedens sp.]